MKGDKEEVIEKEPLLLQPPAPAPPPPEENWNFPSILSWFDDSD